MITKKEKTINKDLFTEYFQFQNLKKVFLKHRIPKINKELEKVIKSGLVDLDKKN